MSNCTPEQQAALAAYWAAKSFEEERVAYRRMLDLGLPDGYSATPIGDWYFGGSTVLPSIGDLQKPGFITGDWSVEYPPIAEPKQHAGVFPRQAMVDGWRGR